MVGGEGCRKRRAEALLSVSQEAILGLRKSVGVCRERMDAGGGVVGRESGERALGGKPTADSTADGAVFSGLWSAAQGGAVALDSAIEAQAASLFWDWEEAQGHDRTSGFVGREVEVWSSRGWMVGMGWAGLGRAVGLRRRQARYPISRTKHALSEARQKLAKSADGRETMSMHLQM